MDSLAAYLESDAVASAQFPDQDVLADVFKGKWRVLPWWCNALKTLRAAHKNLWDDKEVRLLHYMCVHYEFHRIRCAGRGLWAAKLT